MVIDNKWIKISLSLILGVVFFLTSCKVLINPDIGDSVINIAAISGITAPAFGETPVIIITETDQYTGTVIWSDSPVTFAGSTTYRATITLTAKAGFTLSGVAAGFFTVAGATLVSNTADSGVVTAFFPVTLSAEINIAAIAGITLPAFGETPVTTITETNQYTGTVTWSETPIIFAGSIAYTATITLTAKTGFTLTGVAADFFTVAGTTSVSNTAGSGVVTAFFPKTGEVPPTIINISAIRGIIPPVVGQTPVSIITETDQYTGTVTWSDSPVTFEAITAYTATITLVAKTGFTLTGVAADFFTVAGASSVSNTVALGIVTVLFPPTSPTVINISAIRGIMTPVVGQTPVTIIAETDQYSGTVTWSDTPATFAGSTAYTATITLIAKTGFTLTGVAADFFTAAGATPVSNTADSGVVNALFPETSAVINISAISGIISPVVGETPVTTITETNQYTGTVAWSDSPTTFAVSTVYTATITLTAKIGFTLSDVTSDFFTVGGATPVSNTADIGVVTAVFPITENGDYSSENIGVLKYVPAGTFQRDDKATNTSTVSLFRMSAKEITRDQFEEILGSGTDPSDTSTSSSTFDPVQKVNWYHAIAFCNKLSITESLTPVYMVSGVNFNTLTFAEIPTSSNTDWDNAEADWDATGYRLPTEMEWVWAAMGAASDSKAGDIVDGVNTGGYAKDFAGSDGNNAIDDYAWYSSNSNSKTQPAGTRGSNELGLFDMSGNVWEWCWDWKSEYPTGDETDYRGAASATYRVLRGGSWNYDASFCTLAIRGIYYPYDHYDGMGFRVVRL